MATDVKPNYQFWQESGWDWYAEVKSRRRTDPIYAAQEVLLKGFFQEEAGRALRELGRPLRVLEFGCGFGRHLRYLHPISGLEVYGCDQSPAMLSVARSLLLPRYPELEGRLLEVGPEDRLPYSEGFFDIVYTVSVLIHVCPEDLYHRVRELRRVASDTVLHLEMPPVPVSFLWDEVHEGCWLHDLVGAHQAAGPCKIELDTDSLGPRVTVCKVTPADANVVRVLSGGRWRERPDEVLASTVEAALRCARFLRVQAQNSASAMLRDTEELASLKRTRAVRLVGWSAGHPFVGRLGAALFDAAYAIRRLLRRLMGWSAAAGQRGEAGNGHQ